MPLNKTLYFTESQNKTRAASVSANTTRCTNWSSFYTLGEINNVRIRNQKHGFLLCVLQQEKQILNDVTQGCSYIFGRNRPIRLGVLTLHTGRFYYIFNCYSCLIKLI